jgi:membrane protein involved in colicin uptake
LSLSNDFKSSLPNIELGGYTSEEKADRAERDRKEKAERVEKDRVKTARKVQEKAEKTERDRTKTARKVQEKADRTEKDRAEKARKVQDKAEKDETDRAESARRSERARLFDQVLSQGSAHSKGCCEPCNFHVVANNGEYQPCKLGHEDSGPNKEICVDCTESRYHPKK